MNADRPVDLANERLVGDGDVVPFTSKALAVLHRLVEHRRDFSPGSTSQLCVTHLADNDPRS
jgi:hypothetical protein